MVKRGETPNVARSALRPDVEPLDAIVAWQQLLTRPLFVYFIQDGDDGPVKIGQAHDPRARLAELQCGNPRDLHLRAVVLATDTTEATLHERFGAFRLRGEWFLHADVLIARAQQVQRQQAEFYAVDSAGYGVAELPERFIVPAVSC